MFTNQYEEHLADSIPDNSRWDGFDRGDADFCDEGERVIGRMTSEAGKRVVVIQQWSGDLCNYEVRVNRRCVFSGDDRQQALTVGRWWLNGCPC